MRVEALQTLGLFFHGIVAWVSTTAEISTPGHYCLANLLLVPTGRVGAMYESLYLRIVQILNAEENL